MAARFLPGAVAGRGVLLLLLLAAVSCVKNVDLPGPEGDGVAARPGPCGLLTEPELELALNVPVSTLQEAGRPVLAGMKMCAGGTPDSAALWGTLDRSAAQKWSEYRRVSDEYLEEIRVEGRRGTWDGRLGTLIAETDEGVFGLRISVGRAALRRGESRASYLRSTAIQLTVNALGRLK